MRRVRRRAYHAVAHRQLRHFIATSNDLAHEAVTRIKRIAWIGIVEIEEEGAFRARADQRCQRAQQDLPSARLRRLERLQRDLPGCCDNDPFPLHHFIPVVAMPVVIKRCKKAKTSVIGNSVTTVIAST